MVSATSRTGRRFVQRATQEPGLTISIVAILVYLFVVHSYKLAVGSTAIVIGLIALLLEGRQLRIPPFLIWYGGFLVWALITLPMGIAPESSLAKWQDFGKLWLIAFLISNAARSEKQWRYIVIGWLGLFALYPFRGTLFNILGGISTQGRYAWNFTFGNPNDLAAITLLPMALCVALIRTPSPLWVRWCARVGAATLPVLIVLTGSRGGLLALAVFAAILLAFSRKRAGIFALGMLALVIALPLMPEAIKQRFRDMKFLGSTETIGLADSSAEQRYTILLVAATIARDNPIFGVGIGNYGAAHARYAASRSEWAIASGSKDSHNAYLGMLAENGVIGFLLMGGAAASLLLGLSRAHRRGRADAELESDPVRREARLNRPPALIAGTVAYLVASIFGSFFVLIFPYLFAVTALGLVSVPRSARSAPAGRRLPARRASTGVRWHRVVAGAADSLSPSPGAPQ